jgi:hypothetical protein
VSKALVTINGHQFVKASLSYSADNLQPGGLAAKDASQCPAEFTPTNWIAYFLYDQTHPTKLLFVHIGQQPIAAGIDNLSSKGWQDSIVLK